MKKAFLLALALMTLASCRPKYDRDATMMAFQVPGTGDFVWENELTCYRVAGQGSEVVSQGIDVWAKRPGKLVSKDWCWEARRNPDRMHTDHDGLGGDFFRVGTGLGCGASAMLADTGFVFPPSNFSSVDVLRYTADEVTFVLHYPTWKIGRFREVSLDRQVTMKAGNRFCKVTDFYNGFFDEIRVAAGLAMHADTEMVEDSLAFRIVNWESVGDSEMGTAVLSAEPSCRLEKNEASAHALITVSVAPDEPFTYYIGSCWSRGGVESRSEWKELVSDFVAGSF